MLARGTMSGTVGSAGLLRCRSLGDGPEQAREAPERAFALDESRLAGRHDLHRASARRVGALAPEPQVGADAVAHGVDVARLARSDGHYFGQQFARYRVVRREEALFLVRELLVERVARDARAAADVADRRRAVALCADHGDHGREDALALVVLDLLARQSVGSPREPVGSRLAQWWTPWYLTRD